MYKRQAKEFALLKKLWENHGNIVTIDALCQALWEGPMAVSYTHLDVYKRQAVFCSQCGSKLASSPSSEADGAE